MVTMRMERRRGALWAQVETRVRELAIPVQVEARARVEVLFLQQEGGH